MVLGKLDFPKFVATLTLPGTTPATSTNYGTLFVADRPVVVEGFQVRYETPSTASVTLQARRVLSGQTISAAGAGANMLFSGVALNGATATVISGPVNASSATLFPGDSLALVASGTPTALANATIVAQLKYI